jgi:hypothetical protein
MATKRSGKAANRRSRQRPPRRPVIPQPPQRPAEREVGIADAVPPPDVDAAPRATREVAPSAPRSIPASYVGASRLTERAIAEYHYVGRDLRNIAVLAAIIAVALVAAWLVLPAIGLVSR